MTKAELIDTIARSTDQPKKQVTATLDLAFEQIARAIRKDKRFWVPGFGTFSVRRRGIARGYQRREPRDESRSRRAAARNRARLPDCLHHRFDPSRFSAHERELRLDA